VIVYPRSTFLQTGIELPSSLSDISTLTCFLDLLYQVFSRLGTGDAEVEADRVLKSQRLITLTLSEVCIEIAPLPVA
jgi:hypothetical protein